MVFLFFIPDYKKREPQTLYSSGGEIDMSDRPDRWIHRYFLPVGIGFVLILASLSVCKNNEDSLRKAEIAAYPFFHSLKKYPKPTYIPSFRVLGPDAQPVDIKEKFKGNFIILNVWATWCAPCVKELPELSRLQRVYGNGKYRVVAVSVNAQKDIDEIITFIRKLGVDDIAGYHDYEGQLQKSLPIKDLPVTYIINSRGQILYQATGDARWTSPEILSFLNLLLATR